MAHDQPYVEMMFAVRRVGKESKPKVVEWLSELDRDEEVVGSIPAPSQLILPY